MKLMHDVPLPPGHTLAPPISRWKRVVAKLFWWSLYLLALAGLGHSAWRAWREGYSLEAFSFLSVAALIIWLLLPTKSPRA